MNFFRKDKPGTKFKEDDYLKWHDFKVLPCLDLSLWAKLKNVSITNKLMGEALFPNEFDLDNTERIRQTVKPLANYLNTAMVVFGLARQRKAELLKKSNKKNI